MKIFWVRCSREVFVYGLHRNAIGAMGILRQYAPAMEIRCLDTIGGSVNIPIRELNFSCDDVMGRNPSPLRLVK